MTVSLRSKRWLRRAGTIAATVLLAGCAGPQLQPETHAPVAARNGLAPSDTPASTNQLAQTAKLAQRAERAGLRPVVVKETGVTMYCHTDKDVGTLIPTTKCLSQAELPGYLELQEERQASLREQPSHSGGCGPSPGAPC